MTGATQLIVIYATKSGILRRKIIPDYDGQIAVHQPGSGESRLLIPLALPHDDAACQKVISDATGLTPGSGRCCIVDLAGDVIGVCKADPALDTHPAGQLVAHDAAGPGDRHQDGIFRRRYAIVDRASNTVTEIVHLPLDNSSAPRESLLLSPDSRTVSEQVQENLDRPDEL